MADLGAVAPPPGRAGANRWPRFLPVGDCGLLVEFGDAIDVSLNEAVVDLDRRMAAAALPGVVETVPTYRSLLVEFRSEVVSLEALTELVKGVLRRGHAHLPAAARQLLVPVHYDEGHDEDLAEAATLLGSEPHAVVTAHLAAEYRVFMIGFMPGFTYLGGLPPQLHLPRRATLRARAPAGSIMIGGMQAAIAALPLPTGWYVIGRTPARGFDKDRAEPFLFRAGDRVRFRGIGAGEFARLSNLAAEGAPVAEVVG